MKAFFDIIRAEVFDGRMTGLQVSGTGELLAATDKLDLQDRAYLLATAAHETAFTMQPVTEYGPRAYFDKYNAGTRIGQRLGNTRPGDGYWFRGRGYVQITGRANYLRASQKLGIDLIASPDDALKPSVAGRILVRGCVEGWFTGKRLQDFGDYVAMRAVVNGTDRAQKIAAHARSFERALRTLAAPTVGRLDVPPPDPGPPTVKESLTDEPQPPSGGFFMRLLGAILGSGK